MMFCDRRYEGGVRVMQAVRYPPLYSQGQKVAVPVANIDAGPTILDVAGIDVPASWGPDGISFKDTTVLPERPLVFEMSMDRAVIFDR